MRLEHPLVRVAALLICSGRPAGRLFLDCAPLVPALGRHRRRGGYGTTWRRRRARGAFGRDARDHDRCAGARVWPWLAQLGQDRGGFYSYRVLENLFGCEMPDIEDLVPRLQNWKLGDKLWMYPPHKARGTGFAVLAVHGRAGPRLCDAAIGTPATAPEDGSWSFVLKPIDAGTTRLLFRGRPAGGLRRSRRCSTTGCSSRSTSRWSAR